MENVTYKYLFIIIIIILLYYQNWTHFAMKF